LSIARVISKDYSKSEPVVRDVVKFLRWEVLSTSNNTQACGSPLVGCPLLLIQYIRSYPLGLQAVPPPTTWVRATSWWQGSTYQCYLSRKNKNNFVKRLHWYDDWYLYGIKSTPEWLQFWLIRSTHGTDFCLAFLRTCNLLSPTTNYAFINSIDKVDVSTAFQYS
jgi:hypothetical protein